MGFHSNWRQIRPSHHITFSEWRLLHLRLSQHQLKLPRLLPEATFAAAVCLVVFYALTSKFWREEHKVGKWQNINLMNGQELDIAYQNIFRGEVKGYYKKLRTGEIVHYTKFATAPEDGESSNKTKKKTILLLGGNFDSIEWSADAFTVQSLTLAGHNVIAVNLPGKGKSLASKAKNRSLFLKILVQKLTEESGSRPILVAPSTSGQFAVPLVVNNPVANSVLCGFVPVSPVIKDHSLLRSFSYISVPTLIVHGDRDEEGIDVARKLSRIPSSTPTYIIPNAGQNCFLDQPFLFNSLLNNFVNQLDCNE